MVNRNLKLGEPHKSFLTRFKGQCDKSLAWTLKGTRMRQIMRAGGISRMAVIGGKICNHCGRVYTDVCTCATATRKREERRKLYRKHHADNWYNNPHWKACSRAVRVRDLNLDKLKLYVDYNLPYKWNEPAWLTALRDLLGTVKQARLTVHHIEPRDENKSRWYDMENLISLDTVTHDYIHELYFTPAKREVQALLFEAVKWSM